MITLRIDFTSENILPDGCIAGRIGEHNATTLVITPPSEIMACESVTNLCIAFFTGVGIIHSKIMPKTDTLQILIWKQLTQYSSLAVQLEAYDDDGDLVVKSPVISLKLLPSLCGEVVEADTENPDLTAQVAQNAKARHIHDNGTVLDCFGLNYAGNRPTFMGNNNILALQSDILDRLRDYELKTNVPNAATVDGSTLKMQRKTNNASTDLFSVDLPAAGSVTLKSKYYANDWDNGVIGFDLTSADTFFGFFEPLPDNAFVYDFSVEFNGKTYMSSELYSESLISTTSTLNVFGKPKFISNYGIYLAARTGDDSEGKLYGDISADMGTVTGFTLYYLEV